MNPLGPSPGTVPESIHQPRLVEAAQGNARFVKSLLLLKPCQMGLGSVLGKYQRVLW
jgi:hypothetical protein